MNSGFKGTGKRSLYTNMSQYGTFYHILTLTLGGKKIPKDLR